MRQLFIVRHAQAGEGSSGQRDFDRALTLRGRNDALELGRFLLAEKLMPQKILVSPAKRTLETFSQMNLSLDHRGHEEHAEIYDASFETLRALITATDDTIKSLMIIGHNPGMHTLAMYYAKANEEPQDFSPASLLILDFQTTWDNLQRRSGSKIIFRKPA